MLIAALLGFVTLTPLLVCIAFFTLAERKIIAAVQRRRGPNVVGFWGLLQPFADGLKLLLKEAIVPSHAYRFLFLIAPVWTFVLSLSNWAFIPFSYIDIVSDVSYSLLFVFALSSFGVYGIILAGWASQSRYPFLGAVRSAAQMISYEVSLGLIFVIIALCTQSLNFIEIVALQHDVIWLIFPLGPIAIIFFITALAETNRTPFDLPEAEAEIVAGYNLEYSSIIFAMFFLGEYNNILVMASLISILFLGGWTPLFEFPYASFFFPVLFSSKIVMICFFFVLVRATFPRLRYDQLMDIGWKVFLPLNLSFLIFLGSCTFVGIFS